MKFILYGVGSFSTLCTVVIFIYLLDTGPCGNRLLSIQ